MMQKIAKRTAYLFLLLTIGLASVIYKSYAKEGTRKSGLDIKNGYGACRYYLDSKKDCGCANWQGGTDTKKKCKCGHSFSDHYDIESD